MSLEQEVRSWWCNSGDTVSKDDIASVLLKLISRVEALEEEIAAIREARCE